MKNLLKKLLISVVAAVMIGPAAQSQNTNIQPIPNFQKPPENQATYYDGIVTVYSSKTDLNATILFSSVYKAIYIPGQGLNFAVRIIKGWDNIEPWRADYFYYIDERTKPLEITQFY